MKNIKAAVIGTTLYLAFYALTPTMGLALNLILLMFYIGNALLIYMVYVVLKYGEAPDKKFEDGYWYADQEHQYPKGV